MDTKQMLKDGFVKKQVALLIYRDGYSGKEHIIVVDTPDHRRVDGVDPRNFKNSIKI